METMRSKAKILVLCSLFTCLCMVNNAQDYYGGGGNGSWRKQQTNNTPQKKKDVDDNEPSGYISVNYGFATPEGNFSQPFSQSGYSGNPPAIGLGYGNYAQPGSAFHFSVGIPIDHSNFGIALMFGSYDNTYDINSYGNALNNSLGNQNVNVNPYANSPIQWYGSAGTQQNVYDESSIMGGFFATYPIGRLSIDGRLMLGALLCNLPEQAVEAGDADGNTFLYDVEPSNSTSLAFDIGIGARFMIAQLGRRKLCAMINVDYLYSNVSYNTQQDLYVIPATGPNAGYQEQLVPSLPASGSLPIQLLNITFGIGYQL